MGETVDDFEQQLNALSELEELKKELGQKQEEFDAYNNITIVNLWLNELNEFEEAYDKWTAEKLAEQISGKKEKAKGKGRRKN